MIILHAGFHKTATSTVQQALRDHRDDLPDWHIALEEDLPEIAATTRAYSVGGDPFELTLLHALALDWAHEHPAENLLISCESLAGEMPGRVGGAANYNRGGDLIKCLARAFQRSYPQNPMVAYLSTRAPQSWLESLHWQCTRQATMTEDFATFSARMAPNADLAAQAAAIRAASTIPVIDRAIEDLDNPLSPLLDLMGISDQRRVAFTAPKRMNTRPTHVDCIALADQFAMLNRSGRSVSELRTDRQSIMAKIWQQKPKAQAPV